MKHLGLAVCFLALCGCGGAKTLQEVLRDEYNAAILRPPVESTVALPGTIILVQGRGTDVRSQVVCTAEQALGLSMDDVVGQILTGSTITGQFNSQVGGGAQIDASVVETINAGASYKAVESIRINVSDATVYTIPYARLSNVSEDARDPGCARAIEVLLQSSSDDARLTYVTWALQATIEYSVEYTQEFEAQLGTQGEVADLIRAQLGVEFVAGQQTRLRGERLIWGIQDDQRFVVLDGAAAAGTAEPIRSLSPGDVLRVDSTGVPDAEVSPEVQAEPDEGSTAADVPTVDAMPRK